MTKKSDHYLQKLIDELKMTAKEFSDSLGLNRVDRIYHILNGRNGISTKLAKIIINKYENIDYDWLLTGKGEMLKTTSQTFNSKSNKGIGNINQLGTGNIVNFNPNDVKQLLQLIEQKDKTIGYLRKQIDEQHDNFCLRLDEKERVISEKDKRYVEALKLFDDRMIHKDELFKKAEEEHREAISIIRKSLDTMIDDIREKDMTKAKLMDHIHVLTEQNNDINKHVIELLKSMIKQ